MRISRTPLVVAAVACAVAFAAPARAQVVTLDMPARPASEALVHLCLKARCAFAFVTEPGAAFRTNPVRGAMPWRTALDRMLAGTGLRYAVVGPRAVRIWVERGAEPPPREAAPTTVAAVEVSAPLSAGIETAVAQKRRADVILDAVSAARIGDLPAANLAEALQRIPGVTIEREVGEGQFVSVRGLGPIFQSVTLNGAPVAFNENIRNSTQSGRQFRFRALAPDLLAGATVTKTARADMVDGGIGSNIDIRTVGGLDGPSFLTVRLEGGVEARTGAVSPDGSLSARWRTEGGDVGVVGGLSFQQRDVQYDRFQIQRYRPIVLNGREVVAPNDVRTTVEREQRRRISAFGAAEWQVDAGLALSVDALVSRFDNRIREDRLVYELGERLAAAGASDLRVADGVLVAAAIRDGVISDNTEFSDQAHDNISVGAAARVEAGAWRIASRMRLSLARSRLDTPLQRISATSIGGAAYAFDLGADPLSARRAERLETSLDLTDPAGFAFARYGVRATDVDDTDATFLLDAERSLDRAVLGWRLEGLSLGAQASDRGRNYQRRDREASARPGVTVDAGFYAAATPGDVFSRLIRHRDGAWAAADFGRFREAFVIAGEFDGASPRADDLVPTGADLQSSYRVRERTSALYARLDFSGQVAAWPANGNLGLRRVGAETRVDGSILGVTADGLLMATPTRDHSRDGVWLPSANLAIELSTERRLRLAVSRTATRPSLADLRAATVPASTLVSAIFNRGQAEIDTPSPGTIFNGVGGNPALRPYVATNADISFEWYFDRFGVFSLAAFHKDIDDFIVVSAQTEQLAFATRAGPPVVAAVSMSRPRNAGRARVSGLEAGLSRKFAHGLGVWASATYADASVRGQGGGERLQGVSRWAYSVSPFVARGPLEAHLSWTWRSSFLSGADMQGGGVSTFVVGSAGYLDFGLSYQLDRRTRLYLEASNLTDTIDTAYEGVKSRPLQLARSGRSYGGGLRVRF